MVVKVRSLLACNVINYRDIQSRVEFAFTCFYIMGILGPHQ